MTGKTSRATIRFIFEVHRENATYWATCGLLPGFIAAGDSWEECRSRIGAYMAEEHPTEGFTMSGVIDVNCHE